MGCTNRTSFKDEAERIAADGGPGQGKANNYNKIESPGKKYLEQDKKKETKPDSDDPTKPPKKPCDEDPIE